MMMQMQLVIWYQQPVATHTHTHTPILGTNLVHNFVHKLHTNQPWIVH